MATNDAASSDHSAKSGVVSSPPWSQIVAAAPPPQAAVAVVEAPDIAAAVDSVTAVEELGPVAEGFDDGGSGGGAGNNAASGKRLAWNKPSDGGGSSSSEGKTVMDADWPGLLESARAASKSPPWLSEPAKGSAVELQGTGSVIPSPQRQVRDNAGMNNTVPTHQKTFRRSNSNPSSNGGHPPQLSAAQGSTTATGSHYQNSFLKDHQPRTGFVSNDHPQQQRNSFRNRNGGPHPRGDGAHHHNYGSRRDQGHGNQDWSAHRNFNGRDNYMSPRFAPRFIRPPPPPPNPAHLYPPPPPPIRPFGGMGFSELPHHQMVYVPPPPLDSLRGVPFVPPIPPNLMFFQPPDPQLHTKIVNQIDYYFSNDNLIKDLYLRQKMDDQGWVPISLIAGFKKVMQLTDNIQIVLDAVRTSSLVEVLGDKIRRRDDWGRWTIPPVQFPNVTSSQTVEKLAEQVQGITLEATNNGGGGRGLDVSQNRPFGEINSQFRLSTSEESGQVGIQVSNHSISARN